MGNWWWSVDSHQSIYQLLLDEPSPTDSEMGIRSMLDWKWGSQVRSSPFPANQKLSSTNKHSTSSYRGRDASYESARALILSFTPEDTETILKDHSKTYTSTFGTLQVMETETKNMKNNLGKGSQNSFCNQIDDMKMPIPNYKSISWRDLQVKEKSQFHLLYRNLEKIEEIFLDEDMATLEKDILIQLGKLGALQLFRECLSRSLMIPSTRNNLTQLSKHQRQFLAGEIGDQVGKVTACSRKKEERKLRREQTSEKSAKVSPVAPSSKTISKSPQPVGSTVQNSSKSRIRRNKVARNEAEMSRRVKDVADLERIRTRLETESAQVASFRSWAQAAGVDEKTLQQRLHYGWFCRDKLLRSTHSLTVFLARNYRGLGICLEDLHQAGNVGVLKGAERFDHTRGYQFSTYVQYWIRKEMSTMVEQHSREIHVPAYLSRRINQIKKARRSLYNLHGRYPDDDEIARFAGLSLAKIRFASKCPRIVGSIDQKIGYNLNAKFMEFTSDTSIKNPEEIVTRQHLQKDVSELLQGLHPRESQVLVLRFGFGDGQCKSLEEIARIFRCTKEWIRKIEKSALTKLRKEEVQKNLSQYLKLQV